jgi:acetolactate synthase-1/2/3 large subunit
MQINGGEMIARVLERQGVKNVFALHGGHIDPIFQACYDHGIRIVDTRHEQAAGTWRTPGDGSQASPAWRS